MARKQQNPIVWAKPPEQPKGVWRKEYHRDPECESWEMDLGAGFKIWISNSHVDYRGKWIVRSGYLINLSVLHATNADDAKAEAVDMIKGIIAPIYSLLLQAAE